MLEKSLLWYYYWRRLVPNLDLAITTVDEVKLLEIVFVYHVDFVFC